jgi:hypothetical protein
MPTRRISAIQWRWFLLVSVALLAFVLRIWGIGFGLPYVYHVDEHFYINTALKLGKGVIHNPPYAPAGLSNVLALEYGGYYVAEYLSGDISSPQEFEVAFRRDPSAFYLLARLTSALFGTLTCLVLYVLGKSAFGALTGLAAASLLAASFLHVRDSHYAVPDAALTFFIVLSIALAAVALRTRKRRFLYLAALAGGLATAMKWTALPVGLALAWASLWVGTANTRNAVRRLFGPTTIVMFALFALGFAVGSPQVLINPAPYINEALGLAAAGRAGGFTIWEVDTLPGWLFYGKALLIGVGPGLLILGLAGILRRLLQSMKTFDKVNILIVLFPLSYYLVMGSTRNYFSRYALPLIPFVALFAAEMIASEVSWAFARGQRRLGWAVGIALVVGALAEPLANTIRHDVILTREDTRTLAKQWIETHLPAGSRVAVDWPTHSPPLSTPESRVPDSIRVYDVMVVGRVGLSDHPLDWYRNEKIEYLVSSSFIYDLPLVHKEWEEDRRAFYATLDQDLRLLYAVEPGSGSVKTPFAFDEIYGPIVSLWQRERPGPTIRIYEVE